MAQDLPGELALELQALGSALLEKGVMIYNAGYDKGLVDGQGQGGGFSQEQVDAIVAQKQLELRESLKAQILVFDEEEKAKILALLS